MAGFLDKGVGLLPNLREKFLFQFRRLHPGMHVFGVGAKPYPARFPLYTAGFVTAIATLKLIGIDRLRTIGQHIKAKLDQSAVAHFAEGNGGVFILIFSATWVCVMMAT